MALDVDGLSVSGSWFRHLPHRARLNYRPPVPGDGRWQHGHVIEALYFADSEETAWAEWYRFLAEAGLPPERVMPRNLWRFEIEVEVANLKTRPRLARVGLGVPAPTAASWPPYQEVGDQLHAEGWQGLVAPSAARPRAGRVLCLFRTDVAVTGVKAIPPPKIYRYPPTLPAGMVT